MSGGPALDEEGHVVGINVARRVDGEQVSFLVPASFATALLARGKDAPPITAPAYGIVDEQLQKHQALLDRALPAAGLEERHPSALPRAGAARRLHALLGLERALAHRRPRLRALRLRDGHAHLRRRVQRPARSACATRATTAPSSARCASRRATRRASATSRSSRLSAQHQTKPRCSEDYIDRDGLPLRAVVCMRAYKKLPQLYDVSVLVATLDQTESGVQGRFDAQGVSFANAQKLAQHYLDAFRWVQRTSRAAGAARGARPRRHGAPGLAHRALAGDDRPRPRQRRRPDRAARRRASRDDRPRAGGRGRRRRRRSSSPPATTDNGVSVGRERIAGGALAARRRHRPRPRPAHRPHLAAPAPAGACAGAGADAGADAVARDPLAADARARPRRRSPSFSLNTWIDTDPDGLGARDRQGRPRRPARRRRSGAASGRCCRRSSPGRASFGWHVRVFVVASLAFVVLGAVPPLLAFAFSWPWVTDFAFVASSPRWRRRSTSTCWRSSRRRRAADARRSPSPASSVGVALHAVVQRAAHRPARRGAVHEPPVPAAAAPRHGRCRWTSFIDKPGADAGDPRPEGEGAAAATTVPRRRR